MRTRNVLLLAIIALAGTGVVLVAHVTRTRVRLGGAKDTARVSLADVDHAAFDALLQKYVDEQGLVAYGAWKNHSDDQRELDDYLARCGAVDVEREAPRAARLAFWVNVYNALTIKGILREYPTSSIRNHTPLVGGYNIWKDLLLTIGDRGHSLDDIEHQILRKMGEPRIHFAVVCAARGCPPLRREAYTASDLDRQLADNARRFFARPANFQADAANNTVFISELLKWYGDDFAPTVAERLTLLRPYFPEYDKLAWIEKDDVTIEYLSYDWALNDQVR